MSSSSRALFGALVITAVLSLGGEVRADADHAGSGCPPGAALDARRTRTVLHSLRSQAAGAELVAALERPPVVCYGNVAEGVLQTDGVVVLQRDRAVAANAARLGHLLHHLVHGLPFDEKIVRRSDLPCDELVSKAMMAERAAHALENRLRQALHLPPLPFEDLSNSYQRRCVELRSPAATPATM
jgi:hypothetical protein